MKIDETLLRMYNTIKEEIKVKYGVEYSIEEINSVVDIQLEATRLGIAKSVTVNWHRFCKFIFTNKYNRNNDTLQYKRIIENNEDILPQDKEKLISNKIIESADKKRKALLDSKNLMINQSTIESLIKTPNVNQVTTKSFVCLTRNK